MGSSHEYRSLAAAQRRAAEACDLQRARDLYLTSAQRFEVLANEVEFCTRGRSVDVPAVIY